MMHLSRHDTLHNFQVFCAQQKVYQKVKIATGKLKFGLKDHSHFKEFIIRFSSKFVDVIIYYYYQVLNRQNIYSTIGYTIEKSHSDLNSLQIIM